MQILYGLSHQRNPKITGLGSQSLSPEDLPDSGIKPRSPALQADSLASELSRKLINFSEKVIFHCRSTAQESETSLDKENGTRGAASIFSVSSSSPESCSVVSDSLWPHGLYSSWNSPGQNTGVGNLFLAPGDLPNPGIEPRSPTLQTDSLSAVLQGKPKNTGVGSLSLLQWIFLTQESICSLLHCRWILYLLSYQGSSALLLFSLK